MQPLDARTLAVTPYPFREDPLTVTVEARLIPNQEYTGDEELREELARAEPAARTFTLQAR